MKEDVLLIAKIEGRTCIFTTNGEPDCGLLYGKPCMKNIIIEGGLCLFNDGKPINNKLINKNKAVFHWGIKQIT